jgi:hypothetical protein
MRFERDDDVRLTREESGIPRGTKGTVLGFKSEMGVCVVQFPGYGTHDVPEESVERASGE